MKASFPFCAITGQEQLKLGLLLNAIDPSIGGVLICGDKGTAKSTAARALAQLLPAIDKDKPAPFISLPLGSTEDRVIGSLDFEQALKEGRKTFQPGLLAEAHQGILFIDEVNLLADHLVDVLLDVAAMGVNVIQREGMSYEHPARFSLIGTMNPEEGELRPQFLDRFGLMVEVTAPKDPRERSEIVRRRLAYESNINNFIQNWQDEQNKLKENILFAQNHLERVIVSDKHIELISQLCCELNVVSLRADIVMYKVVRALAAWNKREESTTEDIKEAAALALPHRRRNKPGEKSGMSNDLLNEKMNNLTSEAKETEQVFAIAENSAIKNLDLISYRNENTYTESGRRTTIIDQQSGHYVGSKGTDVAGNLSITNTIKHSVIRNGGVLQVEKEDWQEKVQQKKNGSLIIFVIDSSSSMAAAKRMSLVKACTAELLKDAYKHRDQVAVISFRGGNAEVLLNPGKTTDQALQQLEQLPTGGRSPLPHALMLSQEMVNKNRRGKNLQALLVILTDGKANVAINTNNDPWQETLSLASRLNEQKVPAIVIDTEADFIRLGKARELATALQADYAAVDDISAETLLLHIRNRK